MDGVRLTCTLLSNKRNLNLYDEVFVPGAYTNSTTGNLSKDFEDQPED